MCRVALKVGHTDLHLRGIRVSNVVAVELQVPETLAIQIHAITIVCRNENELNNALHTPA